ncbi:MAG: quinone-dependent dihydroorotate dehydrogenase [Anaerolineales bacterium]
MKLYSLLRPLLFSLPPETAHRLTLQMLAIGGSFAPARWALEKLFAVSSTPVQAFGLTFPNRLGLAAGYDKDAVAVRGLAALGFGHIEVGTVTPRPQAGNPTPRLFRLAEDQALINRMGFPSQGAERVAQRLQALRRQGARLPILGVNLGKNRETPLEEALQDYRTLMERFAPLADYLVINISSPNTIGLRRLQGAEMLRSLLHGLQQARRELPSCPPLLVKLAPDLTREELEDAIAVLLEEGIEGVILTNTTLERPSLRSPYAGESGGLSGAPLAERSRQMLEWVVQMVEGRMGIISVGGIMSAEEAHRRLEMGATLVQVYTGLVYQGPGLVRQILQSSREKS